MNLCKYEKETGLFCDFLHSLLPLLSQLVLYIGSDLRFKFASESYRKMFTIEPINLIGRHPWEIVGEKHFHKIAARQQAVLAGQRQDFEVELPFENGSLKIYYLTKQCFKGYDEEPSRKNHRFPAAKKQKPAGLL